MSATRSDFDAKPAERRWALLARPVFTGGNSVKLLQGGDELFPALIESINRAEREVWLATYIFHNDAVSLRLLDALDAAARRGVKVRVVVDGFGSMASLSELQKRLRASAAGSNDAVARDVEPDPSCVALAVFKPMNRWRSWLEYRHMRRLHQKLCVVDSRDAFVGGINVIDDRFDLRHGISDQPRLDFAVMVQGNVVTQVERAIRVVWRRAWFGRDLADDLRTLVRTSQPLSQLKRLLRSLRVPHGSGLQSHSGPMPPVQAAFVLRDNVRRRTIERSYITAIRRARDRVDLVSPYFYPGISFRRALCAAARRGVQVRILLQGKLDYRIAGLAARVLYDELLSSGVQVFEYTPAFLHAKVAVVDDNWATVGSSNIDPLSLLLNLEANVIVRDAAFSQELRRRVEQALSMSIKVTNSDSVGRGVLLKLMRGVVAWCAHVYLRVAGASEKY